MSPLQLKSQHASIMKRFDLSYILFQQVDRMTCHRQQQAQINQCRQMICSNKQSILPSSSTILSLRRQPVICFDRLHQHLKRVKVHHQIWNIFEDWNTSESSRKIKRRRRARPKRTHIRQTNHQVSILSRLFPTKGSPELYYTPSNGRTEAEPRKTRRELRAFARLSSTNIGARAGVKVVPIIGHRSGP